MPASHQAFAIMDPDGYLLAEAELLPKLGGVARQVLVFSTYTEACNFLAECSGYARLADSVIVDCTIEFGGIVACQPTSTPAPTAG